MTESVSNNWACHTCGTENPRTVTRCKKCGFTSLDAEGISNELAEFNQRLVSISPSTPITYLLVALNIGVFVLMALNGYGLVNVNPAMAVDWGSNYGPMTLNGEWWRLLTSTFIHFGLVHIAFNMYVLFASGRLIERIFGSSHFLLLYLFSGLTGSMVSLLSNPFVNSAGASGAIFGIFGGILAFVLNKKNAVPPDVMLEHSKSTAIFIAYNLLNGFTHSGIDNGAHIGGLVGGICLGYLLSRPLESSARNHLFTKQLGIACASGVLVLAGLTIIIAHRDDHMNAESHFIFAEAKFVKDETSIRELANEWLRKSGKSDVANKLTADKLDSEVIPQMQKHYDSIANPIVDSNSKYFELQSLYIKYLSDRITYYKLASGSLRNNDSGLALEAKKYLEAVALDLDAIKNINVH
jgi:rhomboid protease GluP